MNPLKLCTFHVGPLLMGVDVVRVQEVRIAEGVTPVPLSPPAVAGIVNLRGQIVSVIDVRERLGLGDDGAAAAVHVVVRSGHEAVGMAVDRYSDVVNVDADAVEAPPETVAAGISSMLAGVHKTDRALLLVLDPDKVLAV